MRVRSTAVFVLFALLAVARPTAAAADDGQQVVKDFYATLIRQYNANARTDSKSVAELKPYLVPDFYELFASTVAQPVRKTPPICWMDPILDDGLATPITPVAVGAPATIGDLTIVPVTITRKRTTAVAEYAFAVLQRVNGSLLVSDFGHGEHGQVSSFREGLNRANAPDCRQSLVGNADGRQAR